jgi:photosystem II stability/assembly factor-like uncharacterized protein
MHQRSRRARRLTATVTFLWASTALAVVNRWTTHWPQDTLYVTSVAIDPLNSDVVYAGRYAGAPPGTASGLLKSENGGLSWSDPSNGLLEGLFVNCVAIDPQTSSVNVGTSDGILASTDGGATWSPRLASRNIYNIVFGSQHTAYASDFDSETYYVSGEIPSNLYKSPDEGDTWNGGQIPFNIGQSTLVVDPTQPSTLYGVTYTARYYDNSVVQKSVDGGLTWTQSNIVGGGSSALAIDPQKPETVYFGAGGGVFKSVDGGSTWTLFRSNRLGWVTALAVDPQSSSTIYAGTSAGVVRSADGGATWTEFGLVGSFISALAIDRSGTRLHVVSSAGYGEIGGVFDYRVFFGALDVSAGSDGKAHVLFNDRDSRAILRTVDGAGNLGGAGPYGPYDGWLPTAVADSSDGLTRVLWHHLDGSAALWLYGSQGNQVSYRLGPTQGWAPVDVAASANMTHILWAHEDGRVGLWSVDNSGRVSYGPTLGPYSGWTAVAIADGANGVTRLLWNKVDKTAGLSLVGPEGLLATYRYSGSGGWNAVDLAVGADGQSRILWTNPDGRMALWRVDDSGNVTAPGPIYAAPAGFTAQRVGAAPDGSTQVLWTDRSGSALLWRMSPDNVFQQSFPVGTN